MTKIIRIIPWPLNIALLVCVVFLHLILQRSLTQLNESSVQIAELRGRVESAELRLKQATENVDHVRLAQSDSKIFGLQREVEKLRSTLASQNKDQKVSSESAEDMSSLVDRPNIDQIPVLDEAQFGEILERRKQIPWGLSEQLLLQGDVDEILASQEWNPSGRNLDPAERVALASLLKDYKFYTRISRKDRVENEVYPLVEMMRQEHEYIEYPADVGPPSLKEVAWTHSELSDDPDILRLYVFPKESFPDMWHAKQVEYQQEVETFVKVYELLNS
jgi:hypothetical protein